MKISIIGSGRVGSALAHGWAAAGHEIILGSRQPDREDVQQLAGSLGAGTQALDPAEAAAAGEVVVLAVPWRAARETLSSLGNLTGKVLVDCTNPISANGGLALGLNTSAGEQVAAWAPGAHVVKAFNSIGSGVMADTDFGPERPGLFLCGDDAGARQTVSRLGADLGFEAVDCGPLGVSRYLEPLTMLWVQLAYRQGLGGDIAFKLIRRPATS
ncbi:MAG: NADPH-dependent F420 reductase [Anaerolineaceae bacterium]|nr:NADPH-dependent F420 reductase [Anaerolineaceae bacterium]